MAKLTLRIDFGAAGRVGPGKVRLLELVRELGSIAAAARSMGMSYRRAWLLIDQLNRCFSAPVVNTRKGGRAFGGAVLTPFGMEVVRCYRAMERTALATLSDDLAALETSVAGPVAAEHGTAPDPPVATAEMPPQRRPAPGDPSAER